LSYKGLKKEKKVTPVEKSQEPQGYRYPHDDKNRKIPVLLKPR